MLGIWISLESSSPTSARFDGQRSPDANRGSIRYCPGLDPWTKDNECTHHAISVGFALPDHVRLLASVLCLWLSATTCTPSAGHQLRLCKPCSGSLSGGDIRWRT